MKRSLKWVGQTALLAVCVVAVVSAPALAAARLDLISVSSTGEQGNGNSPGDGGRRLSVSADGRFVAFGSEATNLVPGDTNGMEDIFVRDRLLGVTERVSVGSAGEQANDGSWSPFISADGRFVAFSSLASNLVPGDGNHTSDSFVHDRATGVTELVSVGTTGEQGDLGSGAEAMSSDGRFVVFGSYASNLTPEYEYAPTDWRLYLRDRVLGTTELVTLDSAGLPLEGSAGHPAIYAHHPAMSADGRLIAFNLESDPGQNESIGPHMPWDVLVRDRQAMTTEVVTLSETGEAGNSDVAFLGSMSADGRFVSFYSLATNLEPDGLGGAFVRDRVTGTLQYARWGWAAAISGDGRIVAYVVSPGHSQLALWDRRTGLVEDLCCYTGIDFPIISHDGHVAVFTDYRHYLEPRQVMAWEAVFRDVDYDYWASEGIRRCGKSNVILGYPDGLYHPEIEITRDQMAVYVARAIVSPSGDAAIPAPAPSPTFADVPADFWAYRQIEYATSQDVIHGYNDGTYQPEAPVDRGQMAVYIARALVAPAGDEAIPDPEPPYTFPDVPGEDNTWSWCLKHVEYLARRGLVEGYEDGLYHPEYVVTRDQIAVIIAKAFDLTMGFRHVP